MKPISHTLPPDGSDPQTPEKLRKYMVTRFTVLSLLAFISIGLATGWFLSKQVEKTLIESHTTATVNTVKTAISAQLRQEDIDGPVSDERHRFLSEFISKNVLTEEVVKVKLWRPDGTVIFSNDPTIVGKKFPVKNALLSATRGEQVSHITDLRAVENQAEQSNYNRLIEIYMPVYLGESQTVSAVYETYISMLPLERQVATTNLLITIAMSVLFIALFAVVEVASIILRRQNSSLRELSSQLQERADTDGLTGLYNHRHFQSFLEVELDRSHRYKRPLSLLMIDLDLFKSINDRFGHQTGDELLRRMSQLFKDMLRKIDYVARYGGEEFVILLPETPAKEAIEVADRIRIAGGEIIVPYLGQKKVSVSMSVGVADFPACASERESLISAADAALLFAKKHGRNRVCYFGDLHGRVIDKEDLDSLYTRLEHANLTTLEALANAVDARDAYYFEHTKEVAALVDHIAPKMGIDPFTTQVLHLAASLHDVGKIVIPEEVLNKVGTLTADELGEIQTHPEISRRIVDSVVEMDHLLEAILHHHENYDGSGYPSGLTGNEIPLKARILRVLDSYHAMISDRPYRTALTQHEAITELCEAAGKLYDPEVVKKFVTAIGAEESTSALTSS